VGLQALPLHQFQYLLSHLRLTSLTYYARHKESSLARLTIPDVLTPVQYYGVRTQHPGTPAMKRLMLAVLEDALRCIQTYTESPNPDHRKAFAEAETWILDRKAQRPFAFGVICDVLGIERNRLRDGYVSGERNYPTAQIPAAYNGTPCAEKSLWVRWSAGVERWLYVRRRCFRSSGAEGADDRKRLLKRFASLDVGYEPRRCQQRNHHDDREAIVFEPSTKFASPLWSSCQSHVRVL
jgi:hypothetical protein